MNDNYLSVKDINSYIKSVIDENMFLNNVYIKGEISNLKFHTRGHLYFSLKDEESKINAVMFNYKSYGLLFTPKDGDSVLVRGKISVYVSGGNYQITVTEMKEDGVGNLYVLFEELKRKLSLEGLFNEEYKKRIPKIPKKVGVITASTGAAIRDIISTINRRFPLTEILLFPSLVQGIGAKENIVKMIKLADTMDIDVLIVGRGGGSIEDLWAFNEEIVARAIFEAKTPIVSAVGHEIDFTISDFVADKRAPTPTGAAEMVVPDKEELNRYLSDVSLRLKNALKKTIDTNYEKLKVFKTNYIINNPKNLFEPKEIKLDHIIEKIEFNIKRIIENNENRFNSLKLKLELLNPVNILKKGYSVVYKDEKIIKNKDEIDVNDKISILLSNGKVGAEVKEV